MDEPPSHPQVLEVRGGGAWIELVHDRFVTPILEANRDWEARNLNPLTQAARAWQSAEKPQTQLYRDRQLADGLAQLERAPDQFGDLERRFLKASQDEESRRKARR